MCRAFGPLSNLNYVHNYKGWLDSYLKSRPHAIFCGEVAQLQLMVNRDFLNEQPHPSWMYELQPWPSVLQDERVDSRIVDQCMVGAMGSMYPVRKQTGVVGSDQRLLKPFEGFVCDGSHPRENLTEEPLRRFQVWPWRFAQVAADGIEELIVTKYGKNREEPK